MRCGLSFCNIASVISMTTSLPAHQKLIPDSEMPHAQFSSIHKRSLKHPCCRAGWRHYRLLPRVTTTPPSINLSRYDPTKRRDTATLLSSVQIQLTSKEEIS